MRIAFSILAATLVATPPASAVADAVDWKYFGPSMHEKIETITFYDSAGMATVQSGEVRIWFKQLPKKDVHSIIFQSPEKIPSDILNAAAKRVADNYISPLLDARSGAEETLATSLVELVADKGAVQPLVTALLALDCKNLKAKVLQVTLTLPGELAKTEAVESTWTYIAPETALSRLSKIACVGG